MPALSDLALRLIGPKGPFELVRDRPDNLLRFVRPPHTVCDLLAIARRSADRPFLRSGERSLSLHQALDAAERVKAALEARGQGRQTVGLAVTDPLDWIVALFALIDLGAGVALLPPDMEDEVALIGLAGCASLIRSPGSGAAGGGLPSLALEGGAPSGWPLSAATDDTATVPQDRAAVSPADLAVIAFTSGTMSRAKAVRVTHENLVAGLRTMQLGATLAALRRTGPGLPPAPGRSRSVLLAPLTHVGGYGQVIAALTGGSELIFPPDRSPEAIAALVAAERATSVMGAPERLVWDLVRLHDRHDLSSLTTIGVFGVALEPEAFAKIRSVLPAVRPGAGYGLTETSGSVTLASDEDLERKPGTSGAPAPNVEIQIRNAAGDVLQAGEQGAIWLRGAMVTKGYIGRETPIRDGWFETGDSGWLDSDGFLFVVDRSSFSVEVDGLQLSSATVEALARASPGIEEVAAVRPPASSGFEIALFVAATERDAAASRRALEEAWPSLALRITVRSVPALPRTRSGKIDRKALLDLFEGSESGALAVATG